MKALPLNSRGVALIIVLGIIILLLGLIVAFITRAGSERSSSSSYSAANSSRNLADLAVNLVQGQINDATTRGADKVWATQPGAIRVFNNDGSLGTIYRLYSAGNLTTTTAADLANDLPPATWAADAALWCDLNAPATGGNGTTSFPILDPRDPANPANTVPIEGFSINATTQPAGTSATAVPMPVRWLYVLKDGTIVAPAGGGTTVTMPANPDANYYKNNPIIGRIAFWTDDDTCKVNINTAGISGTGNGNGTFWDTPRFYYPDEYDTSGTGLAFYQPAKGEYQRYPGHPATTTLNKVLLGIGVAPGLTAKDVLGILPRYAWGGSEAATKSVWAAGTIAPKSDRLFSSVGEVLFDKNRQLNGGLNKQQLETSRFFLTAHSRAPEINMFGKPRVAIWPIHKADDDNHRSTIDKLIAFCSTTNGTYYFTRELNNPPPGDINHDISLTRNRQLMGYLDKVTSTPIPGFGGSFSDSAKYGADQRQILTEIFDYVRTINLRDSTVAIKYAQDPTDTLANAGSGYTAASWPVTGLFPGAGQVVPSVNPTINGTAWNTQGVGRFPRISEASMLFVGMGRGNMTSNSTDKGWSVPSDQLPPYTFGHTQVDNSGISGDFVPLADTTAVQAFFLMNFFDPAQGFTPSNRKLTIVVSGLQNFSLTADGATIQLNMPPTATIHVGSARSSTGNYRSFMTRSGGDWMGGGIIDFRELVYFRKLGQSDTPTASPRQFPFYSQIVPVPNTTANMTLSSAALTIDVYAGDSTATGDKIQTYNITFPAQQMPLPLVETDFPPLNDTGRLDNSGTNDHRRFGTALKCWNEAAPATDRAAIGTRDFFYFGINSLYDTVFSMVPTSAWADYRLMAQSTIPAAAWQSHPNAGSRMAHSLRGSAGWLFSNDPPPASTDTAFINRNAGALVNGVTQYYEGGAWGFTHSTLNTVPPTLTAGAFQSNLTTPGDWDNGTANYPDGPFINKPDEGNNFQDGATKPYFLPSSMLSKSPIPSPTFFSANRMVPSPGILGSLPTGVLAQKPWQTLLFRPGPAGHPGSNAPKDHLLMDLFWMPVAEPYAISEPFSTDGKVNLNYQIVPFSYITRNTALRSVLASEKVAMVGRSKANEYKRSTIPNTGAASNTGTVRLPLNLDDTTGTLRQFKEKFTSADQDNNTFKSATEICDIYLVPEGQSWTTDSAAQSAWYGNAFALVGDNTRERPYADIYPRLTTKSNSYTVYFTVQALRNPTAAAQNQWDEAKGKIISEYRGSVSLERYIDPADAAIPDYAANPSSTDTLDKFYRWRITGNRQFAP